MAYQHGKPMPSFEYARQVRPPRCVPLLAAALFLVVALGWGVMQADLRLALAARTLITTGAPVYSVHRLQERLARHPEQWLGRTVLVEGQAAIERTWTAPDSIETQRELLDPGAPGAILGFALVQGTPDPLRAALRRLPLIGGFAPRPQVPHWGTQTTYRVSLRAAPAGACTYRPCYEALLLDAAPGSVWEH